MTEEIKQGQTKHETEIENQTNQHAAEMEELKAKLSEKVMSLGLENSMLKN